MDAHRNKLVCTEFHYHRLSEIYTYRTNLVRLWTEFMAYYAHGVRDILWMLLSLFCFCFSVSLSSVAYNHNNQQNQYWNFYWWIGNTSSNATFSFLLHFFHKKKKLLHVAAIRILCKWHIPFVYRRFVTCDRNVGSMEALHIV